MLLVWSRLSFLHLLLFPVPGTNPDLCEVHCLLPKQRLLRNPLTPKGLVQLLQFLEVVPKSVSTISCRNLMGPRGWQAWQDWTCPVLSRGTKWTEGWDTQTRKPRGKKQTPPSNLVTSGIPVVASMPSPPWWGHRAPCPIS